MDAFPGYTYFNPTKKVLCAIQIVEDSTEATKNIETVFPHKDDEVINESGDDSVPVGAEAMNPFTPYEQVGYGNKTLSDLGNVKFAWKDGVATATGSLKKISGWTEFDSSNGNGYFYAIRFEDDLLNKPLTLYKKADNNTDSWTQGSTYNKVTKNELFWVLKLDTNKVWKFTSGGKTIAQFDFTKVMMNESE